jgi:hypothetical protein
MIQPRHYVFAQTALLALWLALDVAGELRQMLRRALADKVGREELEMAVRRPLADSRGNRDEPLRPNPRRLDA